MNKKKLYGAIISAAAFIIYFGIFFILFTSVGVITKDIPLYLFIIMMIFLLIPFVGVIFALYSRIKEIKGGEEEEAKKY